MRDPVKRLKLYETIKSDIASGVYLAGEFLPNEFELAEKYGYSRVTVRSMLAMLEDDRLIELLRGKGRRICQVNAGKTWNIGYLIGGSVDLDKPFYNRFFTGIEKSAADAGYGIMIERYRQGEQTKLLSQHNVDGIIIEVPPSDIDIAGISSNVPAVLLDSSCTEMICDVVSPDISGGMLCTVKYLKDLGHKRIALIDVTALYANVNQIEVRNAFSTAFEFYFPGSFIADKYYKMLHITTANSVPETEAVISQAIEDFIAMPDGPTAVICCDLYALISIRKICEKRIKIPEQMSVVGFDNMIECEHCVPTLTSVDHNPTGMGCLAVELLLKRINNPERPFVNQSCGAKLVVRKSSGTCISNKIKININKIEKEVQSYEKPMVEVLLTN